MQTVIDIGPSCENNAMSGKYAVSAEEFGQVRSVFHLIKAVYEKQESFITEEGLHGLFHFIPRRILREYISHSLQESIRGEYAQKVSAVKIHRDLLRKIIVTQHLILKLFEEGGLSQARVGNKHKMPCLFGQIIESYRSERLIRLLKMIRL